MNLPEVSPDTPSIAELRAALDRLDAATAPAWGTMPAIKARPDLDLEFASERTRFLERLVEVEAFEGVIQHAMYGAMKADDAKALVRHHTTHHFHQFGVV